MWVEWGPIHPQECTQGLSPASPHPPHRFFVMAAFNLLFILTPELLPTSIRASAMGLCIMTSRLGGLSSPFVAVSLIERGMVRLRIKSKHTWKIHLSCSSRLC